MDHEKRSFDYPDHHAQEMRFQHFRGTPIHELALTNPTIQQVLRQYAAGVIITKEECLAQMVVKLSELYTAMENHAIRMHQNSTFPIIIPGAKVHGG